MQDSVPGGVRRQIVAAVSWNAVSQAFYECVAIAVSIVLARLLDPTDFGLIAMAAVFTGFSAVLNKIGLAQSLVFRHDVGEDHRSTAFWLGLLNGTIIAAVVASLAPVAGRFYSEPRVVGIMITLSAGNILAALARVPDALLRRRLDFRSLGVAKVCGTLFGGSIAVTMAFRGAGVWSLAAYPLLSVAAETTLLWVLSGWRPRPVVRRQAVRDLFGFSANLSGAQILNFWTRNADNLLVGRFLGSAALGYYARAYTLMLMPVTQVSDVIGRAVWPVLARIQDDKRKTAEILLKGMGVIALVTFPAMIGAFVVADKLIVAIYGGKWAAAAPTFRILCLVGLLQSITNTGVWVFQAQGRTDIMFKWSIVKGVLNILGFIIGAIGGRIEYLAVSYLVVSFVLLPFDLLLPARLIGLRLSEIFSPLLRTVACAGFMGVCVWLGSRVIPPQLGAWSSLLCLIGGGVVVYVGLVHAIGLSAWREALGILRMRRAAATG